MTATAKLVLAIFAMVAAVPATAQQAAPSKAIYYTQASADAAPTPALGSVVWRRVERDDGTAAIEAKIAFDDPALGVTVTVSSNTDKDLQASHLVEVAFENMASVSDAGIERLPALVAKPEETARGRPFLGAGVAVTDSVFWIALSGKHAATNIALLRAGQWFDVPILFRDRTRALFTFETGPGGRQVIDEVMATWPAPAAASGQ